MVETTEEEWERKRSLNYEKWIDDEREEEDE